MLKGTQTEKNLQTALKMEGKMKTKFAYFAYVAKKEKEFEAAKIFESIAGNAESSPSIWWHGILETDKMHTYENLLIASKMYDQYAEKYLNFANIAKEEGFPVIETYFKNVADYDLDEKDYFEDFSKDLEENTEKILN